MLRIVRIGLCFLLLATVMTAQPSESRTVPEGQLTPSASDELPPLDPEALSYAGSWNSLASWPSEKIVAWEKRMAVDFGVAHGLWVYDYESSPSWTRLTSWDPTVLVVACRKLFAIFEPHDGLWIHDGTQWTRLTPWIPVALVPSGYGAGHGEGGDSYGGGNTGLVVDFGPGRGVWNWDCQLTCSITQVESDLDAAVPTTTFRGTFCEEPLVSCGQEDGTFDPLTVLDNDTGFITVDVSGTDAPSDLMFNIECPDSRCEYNLTLGGGAVGPMGPMGPIGPEGPQGPPGVSGWNWYGCSDYSCAAGFTCWAEFFCDLANEKVLNFGLDLPGVSVTTRSRVILNRHGPIAGDRWIVEATNENSYSVLYRWCSACVLSETTTSASPEGPASGGTFEVGSARTR